VKRLLFVFVLLTLSAFFLQTASAAKPEQVSLVSWGVGGMFHAMSVGVGDSVKKTTGIKTNILPASNDTGRLLPVKAGEAQFFIAAGSTGWLGTRGAGIFSQPQWGPQPLRVAWRGGHYFTGFFTRGNSGIKTLEDVKGKRVGQVPGSPTLNWLLQGAVAFGGYTMDDVQTVNMAGYGAACKATIQGSLDLWVGSATSGHVRELSSKPSGIQWMDLKPEKKEAWKRLWEFAPWSGYGSPEIYAGKEKGHKPYTSLKYAAFFWTYDHMDEETVYQYAKGVWDSYDLYKDKHPRLKGWDHKAAADTDTCFFPFHPGLIRLLKEKGVWTAEHEAWQKKQVENEAKRAALWKEAMSAAKNKKIKVGGDAFQAMWKEMLLSKGLYR
jgi:TRAP transporter TAXI family solute receptor